MGEISAGDLVVVVRTICGCTHTIGIVRRVEEISRADAPDEYGDRDVECSVCGKAIATGATPTAILFDGPEDIYEFPLSCLKRIPPLAAPETITEHEELHA